MIVDVICFLGLFVAVWMGYKRGLIRSLFFLIGIYLGTTVAMRLSHWIASSLHEWINVDPKYIPIISFALLFIGVVLAVMMLARILEGVLKTVHLNLVNRLAGALCWLGIGAFVISSLGWYLEQSDLLGPETMESSVLYGHIRPVSPWVLGHSEQVLPYARDIHHRLEDLINGVDSTATESL